MTSVFFNPYDRALMGGVGDGSFIHLRLLHNPCDGVRIAGGNLLPAVMNAVLVNILLKELLRERDALDKVHFAEALLGLAVSDFDALDMVGGGPAYLPGLFALENLFSPFGVHNENIHCVTSCQAAL